MVQARRCVAFIYIILIIFKSINQNRKYRDYIASALPDWKRIKLEFQGVILVAS